MNAVRPEPPRGGCENCGDPVRTRKKGWGWVCAKCVRLLEHQAEQNRQDAIRRRFILEDDDQGDA
jgi:hypothetical protein